MFGMLMDGSLNREVAGYSGRGHDPGGPRGAGEDPHLPQETRHGQGQDRAARAASGAR